MATGTVMIVAQHAVIGALLGSLVELAGHRAAFPEPGENIWDAVGRASPTLTLLDADHPHSTDIRVFREARTVGSPLLLFSSSMSRNETETVATSRHLPSFNLPIKYREFVDLVDQSLATRRGGTLGTSGEHSVGATV